MSLVVKRGKIQDYHGKKKVGELSDKLDVFRWMGLTNIILRYLTNLKMLARLFKIWRITITLVITAR